MDYRSMILAVVSGKGSKRKTALSASFAVHAPPKAMMDSDVDAAISNKEDRQE